MNGKIISMSWAKIAMVSCFIACLCDFFSASVFARYYPGYNPVAQPTSVLGAAGSPIARLVSLSWIFFGLLFLLYAAGYGLSNYRNLPAHKIAAWLIAIYGFGEEIGSGVLPGNHVNGHITTIGWFHDMVGGIGMAALMILPLVLLKKFTRSDFPLMHRFCKTITVIGFIIFVGFTVSHLSAITDHRFALWHGLWQRLWTVNYYVFLMVIAIQLVIEVRKFKKQSG
jgi:hypothetical protein